MFEAYAIAVTLKLNNLISPQLGMLAKEFERLDELTLLLTKSLAKISVDAAGFKGLTTAANSTNRAFERAAVSAAAFHKQLQGIGAASAAALPMIGPRTPLPPAPGGGGAGGNRRGGGFHGGNIHMGPGGVGLGSVGMATGDWFWPLAATGAAIYGGASLFESAKNLDSERQRFRLYGMSEAQNQEAFRYVAGMRIYGSTQTSNMAAFREAQGVFRESGLNDSEALRGAKLAAPVLAKLDFLSSSLDDESAAKMKTANMNMLRYVESSGGLQSAEEFNRIANFGFKLNASSGGTVDWAQLRQLKARAGAAGFHLTDDAMARLEPIIGEMKGGAVGFGLSTAFNRLTGAIRIPNQVAHELVDNGIWDKQKVVFNQNGGIKNFTGNPLGAENSNLLMTNPERFYEEVIRPIYTKMNLSATDVARQNVMLFGTTGGRNMTLVENQLSTIHRSIDALAKTKGIDAAMAVGRDSLTGQQKEFEAAWTDFKTNWGTTALPFFTGILKAGSFVLRHMPGGSENHISAQEAGGSGAASFVASWAASKFGKKGGAGASGSWGPDTIVNLHLDGEKIATAVVPHVAKGLNGPQTGISDFDSRLSPMPAGGTGSW